MVYYGQFWCVGHVSVTENDLKDIRGSRRIFSLTSDLLTCLHFETIDMRTGYLVTSWVVVPRLMGRVRAEPPKREFRRP